VHPLPTQRLDTSDTDKEFGTNVILPWTAATNWVTDSDECNWFGITCESEKVVSLVLFGNRLSGSFPAEVTLLKDTLTSLDISHNLVHNEGDEGNAWLGDLTNIRYLIYAYNFFQYNGIPTIISKLQQLRHYDCSYNLYAGPLTEEHFVGMPLLTFLAIRGNGYHSPIPASMVALPALTWLYAENASLTGTLDFMAGMPGLCECSLRIDPLARARVCVCVFVCSRPHELACLTRGPDRVLTRPPLVQLNCIWTTMMALLAPFLPPLVPFHLSKSCPCRVSPWRDPCLQKWIC
jgi:hypothetical protein